jgi:hypothetical protein
VQASETAEADQAHHGARRHELARRDRAREDADAPRDGVIDDVPQFGQDIVPAD